jgi:ElaB/YqjD/DUF883 family membrane-anchored ribosome-binding protein
MSTGNTSAKANAANQNGGAKDRVVQTVGELGDNPLALLAGGVAVGVLVGMLLPRVAKERELLDPLGRTLADRATAAAQAAKEAGRQEIDSLIPNKDDTKDRVSALFGNILEAAKGAAQKA